MRAAPAPRTPASKQAGTVPIPADTGPGCPTSQGLVWSSAAAGPVTRAALEAVGKTAIPARLGCCKARQADFLLTTRLVVRTRSIDDSHITTRLRSGGDTHSTFWLNLNDKVDHR